MDVSVIICTHQPRSHYLVRVLDALKAQTLPHGQWELLLIDNASENPLSKTWDLSWHPNARHIREDALGLTPARLRGIREAQGDFLVFVDDDNLLVPDYLAQVISLFSSWPFLGALGCSIQGEFETTPPDWLLPHIASLAILELKRDHWANSYAWSVAVPFGAGLAIRKQIGLDYENKVRDNPLRQGLDRSGRSVSSGGDTDLALCAVDLGLGTGRFTKLKLVHLIPAVRLTPDYFVQLQAGFASSGIILDFLRNNMPIHLSFSWKERVRWLWNYLRAQGVHRAAFVAADQASWEAKKEILAYLTSRTTKSN